jgi:hypothetical protein
MEGEVTQMIAILVDGLIGMLANAAGWIIAN